MLCRGSGFGGRVRKIGYAVPKLTANPHCALFCAGMPIVRFGYIVEMKQCESFRQQGFSLEKMHRKMVPRLPSFTANVGCFTS